MRHEIISTSYAIGIENGKSIEEIREIIKNIESISDNDLSNDCRLFANDLVEYQNSIQGKHVRYASGIDDKKLLSIALDNYFYYRNAKDKPMFTY